MKAPTDELEYWISNINHGLDKVRSGEGIIRKATEEIQRILEERENKNEQRFKGIKG